jgi:ferredoxin-NADP reductase
MKAKLVDRREVAERTLTFALEPEGGRLEFQAGQCCDVGLLGPPHTDDAGDIRTLSIASSPLAPRLLFATRLTGSAYKRSLAEIPIGTDVEIEGPFGSFTLHPDRERPAVFLAGGIGITPFRGMIEDLVARKDRRPVTLVYSNRDAAGTAFLDDFERWEGTQPGFRLVATLTQPAPGAPWARETGRVDAGFLRKLLPGNETALWYAVGPGGFVTAMEENLASVGVEGERFQTEVFAGY